MNNAAAMHADSRRMPSAAFIAEMLIDAVSLIRRYDAAFTASSPPPFATLMLLIRAC